MYPLLKKANYILLICFVSSLPFLFPHVKINSLLIILLIANSIPLYFSSKNKIKAFYQSEGLLLCLFVAVYLSYVIGLFRTENTHEAFFELQKKLSIFIFPVILYFTPKLTFKEIRTILLSFAISCLFTAVFCILVATYHFVAWNDPSFFFYHNFSTIVGMHATYLSMYFCFSIAILLYIYIPEINSYSLKRKIGYCAALVILIVSMFLLAGRMQLLILALGTIIYFSFLFSKKGSLAKAVGKASLVGVFILGLALLFPQNRERFKEAINYNGEYSIEKKWGEKQMRYLMWSCALDLIKEKPLMGVGTGDTQDELQECYVSNEYVSLTFWKNTRFNAHNQFLEITIGLGIVGLIILIISLCASVITAYQQKKIIYIVFISLFVISCLTESLLERQSGIVFYAFFNSLFAFNSLKK